MKKDENLPGWYDAKIKPPEGVEVEAYVSKGRMRAFTTARCVKRRMFKGTCWVADIGDGFTVRFWRYKEEGRAF